MPTHLVCIHLVRKIKVTLELKKTFIYSGRISEPTWQRFGNKKSWKADKQKDIFGQSQWTLTSGKSSSSGTSVVFRKRDSNPLQEFAIATGIDATVNELKFLKTLAHIPLIKVMWVEKILIMELFRHLKTFFCSTGLPLASTWWVLST